MEEWIRQSVDERDREGLLRELYTVDIESGSRLIFEGREYINFSSNDYLGLSSHPAVIEGARKGLSPVFGTTASRLMTGSTPLHALLEKRIAALKKKPEALVLNTGYQTNTGIISAVIGRGDAVFFDRLCHASIVDGILLSGARPFRFRHNDMEHLRYLLEKGKGSYRRALIITETVFSMDGDKAPLQELVELRNGYGAMLMVDEAHATGIFGPGGEGVAAECGLSGECDIIMGTFSKALGGYGAYAAVSSGMKKFLINRCRSFIYSTSLPQAVIGANLAALEILEKEPERRRVLLENAEYLRGMLEAGGLKVMGESQIVPILTGDSRGTMRLAARLKDKGYWVVPVRPPTVPEGASRLRVSVTFNHVKEVLKRFAGDILAERA